MKKFVLTLFVLCFSVSLWAVDKSDMPNGNGATTPGGIVTLTDGGVTVAVNSFGRAGQTSSACAGVGAGFRIDEVDSVLCEHTDFIAMPTAVRAVDATSGCTVVNPITADAANHATSTVQCGDCTIDYDQLVDDASKAWYTTVTLTGCTSSCFYTYTDYDVHGFPNNGASWHADEGGFLGQIVVRNNQIMPDVHYLLTDQSGASTWEMGEFPTLQTKLSSLAACAALANGPTPFVGDFTGALHYNLAAGSVDGSIAIAYSHGRDDSTVFP